MESKYEIVVRWSNANGAYIAEVPELPGCMADGQTRQDAVTNAELRDSRVDRTGQGTWKAGTGTQVYASPTPRSRNWSSENH